LSGVVANHFTQRRGLALGIITTGSSIGGFAFSTMFSHVLVGKIGFASGIRIGAFIGLGCLVAAFLLMKQYPKGFKRPSHGPASLTPSPPKSSLKRPAFILVILYGFVIGLGLWFPTISIQLFASNHPNISPSLGSWLLAIINLSSTVGRVVPNWLSDRFGAVEMNIVFTGLNGILAIVMIVCTDPPSIVVFCILYGFCSGAAVALFFPSVISLDPNARSGVRLGLACVPTGVATLVGPPIAAALVGPQMKWWRGCVFAGSVELLAALMLIGVVLLKRRGY